jgi:cyclopropane-fatty-acyl-phospholipid synthase
MDGRLTFEQGSECYDLLYLFSVNRGPLASHGVQKVLRRAWLALRRYHQKNIVENAKRQARHHYDISTELYELFLDQDLNYSCAFYRSPDDTLEQAQIAKLNRAAAKLGLKPGMTVVDIGGGWGSFAIRLRPL